MVKVIPAILGDGWLGERGLEMDDCTYSDTDKESYKVMLRVGSQRRHRMCEVVRKGGLIRVWCDLMDPGHRHVRVSEVVVALGDPECFVRLRDAVDGFVNG